MNRDDKEKVMKITYEQLYTTFKLILIKRGVTDKKATIIAEIIARSSLDGVLSHGVNRFESMIGYLDEGLIEMKAEPSKEAVFGTIERWNGNGGFGITNAVTCMDRAVRLAKENGVGIVAIKNTNHWLRGGTYGWQAADQGLIALCWTNTMPNMPPWGGTDCKLGNNPMVVAIPRENGEHIVLDMAMAQYSYGQMANQKMKNELLAVYGGYNQAGELTKDPGEILETNRVLPIGFWKGSGLSLVLDLIAVILSGGNGVKAIGELSKETSVSQVFLVIDPTVYDDTQAINHIIDETLEFIKESRLDKETGSVRYPGENTLKIRKRQSDEGIEVNEAVWMDIKKLDKN